MMELVILKKKFIPHAYIRYCIALIGTGMMFVAIGCNDPSEAPSFLQSPEEIFWELELNHRAVNLALVAPYDTITLKAVARNVYGDVMEHQGEVRIVSESDRIVVFPDGRVQATGQTSATGVVVIATCTVNGVTRTDTAKIVVTAVEKPPVMESFSIQLPPQDSSRLAALHVWDMTFKRIPLSAIDAAGNPIPRVIAHYRSSEPSVGVLQDSWQGFVLGYLPGELTVHASATVYGVNKIDTLPLTITNRLVQAQIVRDGDIAEYETTIAASGAVYWLNFTRDSLDIVFDEPEQAEKACCTLAGLQLGDTSGNISPFIRNMELPIPGLYPNDVFKRRDLVRGRTFRTPGRYTYRSTLQPNVRGTVIVK